MTENMKLAVALKRCIDCLGCETCPAFGRCNGTFDSIAHLAAGLIEAQDARIAELERRTPPEADNKALTVEELRGIDGEPVWTVGAGGDGWSLVLWDYVERLTVTPKGCNPRHRGDYGKTWLAYRRPPVKGE